MLENTAGHAKMRPYQGIHPPLAGGSGETLQHASWLVQMASTNGCHHRDTPENKDVEAELN